MNNLFATILHRHAHEKSLDYKFGLFLRGLLDKKGDLCTAVNQIDNPIMQKLAEYLVLQKYETKQGEELNKAIENLFLLPAGQEFQGAMKESIVGEYIDSRYSPEEVRNVISYTIPWFKNQEISLEEFACSESESPAIYHSVLHDDAKINVGQLDDIVYTIMNSN